MEDKRLTKHGFPKGFRFVPTDPELITILSYRIGGRRLHPKVAGIFHELSILEYHPDELHEMFERDKEHKFIYFFSCRQRQKTAGDGPVDKKRQRAGAGGQDEDDSGPRPVRLAKGGGWKPSGGSKVVSWPKDKGGFVAGKMVTMVFYDHPPDAKPVKSHWGMHEFTIPLGQPALSKTTKATHLHSLALYRLYRLSKGDNMESDDGAGSNQQTPANVSAAYGHVSAPCPAGQSSFGILTGRNQNQPLAAGASTSRMPLPLPPPQQLPQHLIPNVGHPQYYHHHQYAFGAAPASAAHQRVHTMTMPPAYGTGMPDPQLFPLARPPGTGLPGRQSLQSARPPARSQMPVPPAAANPASHQQAPAKATYGGAGQEANHSGATRLPPPSAPVSTPAPAAESPSAQELAPMTATRSGAGKEAGGDFGSRPAEGDATATAEPGQHVQFADCVRPEKETVPPPIEDWIPADNNDGIGMLEWDLGLMFEIEDGDKYTFTMNELCRTLNEPPPAPAQQEGDTHVVSF